MRPTRGSQAGFALILAILALMLLTFLGLTLATTTSTELQISNNYRWGQQALYNAEAGLEVGRGILAQVGDGQRLLPQPRTIPWDPNSQAVRDNPENNTPAPAFSANRNFEGRFCDAWGYGAGYGQVLVDPNNPTQPFEDTRRAFGRDLTGTFTVWIRRDLQYSTDPQGNGLLLDNPSGADVILTAEGTAPFTATGVFQRANRAIRRLESKVTIAEGCRPEFAQESDTGMRGCDAI